MLIVGAPVWFRVPYNLLSLLLKEKLRERVNRGARRLFSNTRFVFVMILSGVAYNDRAGHSVSLIVAGDHLIRGFSVTTNPPCCLIHP